MSDRVVRVIFLSAMVVAVANSRLQCNPPEPGYELNCCQRSISHHLKHCFKHVYAESDSPLPIPQDENDTHFCSTRYIKTCLSDLPDCAKEKFGHSFINIQKVGDLFEKMCEKRSDYSDYASSCYKTPLLKQKLESTRTEVHTNVVTAMTTFPGKLDFHAKMTFACSASEMLRNQSTDVIKGVCGKEAAEFIRPYIDYVNTLVHCRDWKVIPTRAPSTNMAGAILGPVSIAIATSHCEVTYIEEVDKCFAEHKMTSEHKWTGALLLAEGHVNQVRHLCKNLEPIAQCVRKVPYQCENKGIVCNTTNVFHELQMICNREIKYNIHSTSCYGDLGATLRQCVTDTVLSPKKTDTCSRHINFADCLSSSITKNCGAKKADFLKHYHKSRIPGYCSCSQRSKRSTDIDRCHDNVRTPSSHTGQTPTHSASHTQVINILLLAVIVVFQMSIILS